MADWEITYRSIRTGARKVERVNDIDAETARMHAFNRAGSSYKVISVKKAVAKVAQ